MKLFKKHESKEAGFSLVETLVGIGLLGFTSLITMKMVSQQQSNESYLKSRSEIAKTVALLQSILNKPENCKYMLAGIVPGTNFASADPIPYLRISTTARTVGTQIIRSVLEANEDYGAFYLPPDAIKLVNSSTALTPNSAELIVRFRIRPKAMLNFGVGQDYKEIEKKIPVMVVTDAVTSKVRACDALVSAANKESKKRFCQTLQAQNIATWNDSGTGACLLKSLDCKNGMVPKRIANLGSLAADLAGTAAYGCALPSQVIPATKFFDTTTSCKMTGINFKIIKDPGTGLWTVKCL
jgi:hypothetical protein